MPKNPELPEDQESKSRSKPAANSASQPDLRADAAETQPQGMMLGELLGFSRWLLVIPFVLVVLYVAGHIALMRQPVVAASDTRSMLSADYSPWEFASFAPVELDIIAHIQGDGRVSIASLVIPGNYWPGPPQASQVPTLPPLRTTPVAAVLTNTPPAAVQDEPNTPTATATSTTAPPTSSPQPSAIYTRTPTPSTTPIFTLFPTATATPTRRPPELPTATITSTSLPSHTPTPTRTATPVPSATQPLPTASATTAPSATSTTPPMQSPTNTSVPPTPTETTPPPPPTATDTPVPVFTPTSTPITPVPVETPTPLPPPPNGIAGSGSWDSCWYLYQNYLPREIIFSKCLNITGP